MINKYRKRPVIVEAVQFTGNFEEVKTFVGDKVEVQYGKLIITTFEGPFNVLLYDWIIKGVEGEFYPCKNHIFELTHELI